MTEYRLSESIEIAHGGGCVNSYGISLYIDGKRRRTIEDISTDRSKVLELVNTFNEEALDPVHFGMAVEDFLYDL